VLVINEPAAEPDPEFLFGLTAVKFIPCPIDVFSDLPSLKESLVSLIPPLAFDYA